MDAITALMTRSSPAALVEPAPPPAALRQIFAAAARAPDHGRMQPWRFVVIAGGARARFGAVLAEALARREPAAPPPQLEAERKKPLRAPLVIAVAAAARDNPKVPRIEQVVAVGAAVENMLLAAHALGFGGFWRTGPAAYDPTVKAALGLEAADEIVGFIYLGSIGAAAKPRETEAESMVRYWEGAA